ncbi:hypothetical protein [Streptomyces daliensis]|uniref:Uncharacterized protein n=1 Tax=Streptomyces daliensis TaxID=299421 RepID=A0A8T4ILR3_9ACTN|nr:hypothetical protein [Streptomyces daliensis]
MLEGIPAPPNAEQFSELVKLRLEEVSKSSGPRESVTVDRNGTPLHVEVIEVPLVDLYFNPNTHRIRAQCSHDPEQERELKQFPWGKDGQSYLFHLLQADPANPTKRDPDFDVLKDDLRKHGQNDPGLITHQGILVNGNTRAAALRELGIQSMRVGVLPSSFTWADVSAVELALQLRKDHRRDYSYINRLLAMEEQAGLGRVPDAIAKDFRIQVKTYEMERWILQVIRDQIARSASADASLRLVDFEDAQEKLKELGRDFMNLAAVDPDQAEILKENRIAAIMLKFSKTDVRNIKEGFLDSYLSDVLPDGIAPEITENHESEVVIPGLGAAAPSASPGVTVAQEISRNVSRVMACISSSGVNEEEKEKAEAVRVEVRDAFDKAIDRAGRDFRLRQRKQMAPARLMDACAAIDLCVDELVKARGSRSLDEAAFDEAVVKLRESMQQLARQAGRGKQYPGEGVSWLLEAAAAEGS